jgi:zinc/manganese transport system substrate-binding protein
MRAVLSGFLLGLFLSLVPTASAETTATPAIRAVASFTILADFVRQVGGERVSVSSVVGPGGDAHAFQPTPRHSVEISQADLIFVNGMGFDPWMDELIKAAGRTDRRIDVSSVVKPIMTTGGHHHGHHHGHDHGHNHGKDAADPHFWLDVDQVILVAVVIEQALAELDPEGAEIYRRNSEEYQGRLRVLDQWIRDQLKTLSSRQKKLVTSHDSLAYFARRYGFRVVETALGSVSTESAEPSAAQMARVIRAIRKEQVPAVFFDTTHSSRAIEQIARDAGVQAAPALFTDTLGDEASGVTTYEALMRHNVGIIVEALQTKRKE